MNMRILSILLGCCILSGCANVEKPTDGWQIVRSNKTAMRLSFQPPVGWEGPGYYAWPSYEEWSYVKGEKEKAYRITLRVDRLQDPDEERKKLLSASKASDAETEASDSISANPTVRTIGYFSVDGQEVRIRKFYNVPDMHQCSGMMMWGKSSVYFSLSCEASEDLDRYIPVFLEFVRSLRIQ